ncbi:MAG: bactofilin family protein [Chitinophagales bacterium]
MFGSKKKKVENKAKGKTNKQSFATSHNQINQGTRIEGEITCESDIRIDGAVNGYLLAKAKVVIGETGTVLGDIVCENADVSGKLEGTIRVKDVLHLKSTANIKGDIITQKLIVDSGAILNGTCSMKMDGEFEFTLDRITPTAFLNQTRATNGEATARPKGQKSTAR